MLASSGQRATTGTMMMLGSPARKADWETLAGEVGTDGGALLEAIYPVDAGWLREIPAVQILRHVWVHNYVPTTTVSDGPPGRMGPHQPHAT